MSCIFLFESFCTFFTKEIIKMDSPGSRNFCHLESKASTIVNLALFTAAPEDEAISLPSGSTLSIVETPPACESIHSAFSTSSSSSTLDGGAKFGAIIPLT
eukprot:Gb_04988 [translate_table: standard]